MSEAKYLRYIAVWPEAFVEELRPAPVHHFDWLLEREIAPMDSNGVAKLNVRWTGAAEKPALLQELDVATVSWPFDGARIASMSAQEQQPVYLEELRQALTFAGQKFGWDLARINRACERIKSAGFKGEIFWPKQPLKNKTRTLAAQVLVEIADVTKAWVIFFAQGGESCRVLLSELGRGSCQGMVAEFFHKLKWVEDGRVQILHRNERDYWLAGPEGNVAFLYEPALRGDPQGIFQLGRMYWEGRIVLRDESRAMELMREADAKGYAHASQFLKGKVGVSHRNVC